MLRDIPFYPLSRRVLFCVSLFFVGIFLKPAVNTLYIYTYIIYLQSFIQQYIISVVSLLVAYSLFPAGISP